MTISDYSFVFFYGCFFAAAIIVASDYWRNRQRG